MTDATPDPTSPDDPDTGAGTKRPDQGGINQPGQEKTDPATGGAGSAGAGGSQGFGTGS